jgi:hypothetical protein
MRAVCCECRTVYAERPGPDQDSHGLCTPCFRTVMLAEGFSVEFVEERVRFLEVAA